MHILISRKGRRLTICLLVENQVFSPGKLDKKNKEIIAIGLSIHINHKSCIEWHINNGSIENVGGGGSLHRIILGVMVIGIHEKMMLSQGLRIGKSKFLCLLFLQLCPNIPGITNSDVCL